MKTTTPEEKRAFVDRLLAAWERLPSQRLGQLISNAIPGDFFYTENERFIEKVEAFAREGSNPARKRVTP